MYMNRTFFESCLRSSEKGLNGDLSADQAHTGTVLHQLIYQTSGFVMWVDDKPLDDGYCIMCGYQCDKAVTKNDTELSSQIDCNNLVGPIGLHVIF